MDYFEIEGGTPLNGTVSVFAAKNAVLPIIAASILASEGTTILRNIPDTADVRTMLSVVRQLGANIEFDKKSHKISIDATDINSCEAPYELVKRMRASFLVMGPLLARFGTAKVSQPGGCAIGARPIDQHIRGFANLGAKITEKHGYTIARAKKLAGNILHFDRPTHTGTENIIMSAVLAEGTTVIINAAQDPEVVDLCNFLRKMGAKIKGAGTSRITIEGTTSLHGVKHFPIGDRLEAGTYLFAALATGGKVKIEGCIPEYLSVVLFKLEAMGAKITEGKNYIELRAPRRPKCVEIITDPYPGFPTDLQAMAMAVLCISEGTGVIWERIFESRFLHVMELQRLGANITILGDRATVIGVDKLEGASVMASDIRAGAGLLIAALSARGKSRISRVYHIDRGYQRIEEKLVCLGAKIERKSE
ncbi:UDP-N-acetylglucosamine 1-carboxyvinyltransferase [bacterium]|nr:MAG: UDP-N-acetylglucosamine 1-carboxyvinyltransferase [bacterium]